MSLPELFGPYLLHHRLSQSPSSEVFLAQTTGDFPRLCAVKRISPELAGAPGFSERFRTDAGLLVRLQHGNLVQILEVGSVEERLFLAMEHVEGVELGQLVAQTAQQGPLPVELALYVALEVCEAVSYLHLRRREETDLQSFSWTSAWPLQVMLSFDGVVKVVDLGSSRALALAQGIDVRDLCSPGYATPEVLRRQPIGVRSDLFSLGLILWELLQGRALVSPSPQAYHDGVLTGSWVAPLIERRDVPGDTIRLTASLLSLDPTRRPSCFEEVRGRLVSSLRRLAPTFGSAALSQHLWRRCGELIGRSEELTEHLVHRTRTERQDAPQMQTFSYGHSCEADRPVPKPATIQPGDPIPGTRYRLVKALGRGASAEVCAAQHVDLDRQVAIKILSPQLAASPAAISRFRQEARACARVDHPNIVEVIDFGELKDGRFFFAMELLDGQSLAELLAAEGRIEPGRAIGIARQLTKAVHAAHQQGIVHRDIKPENIMLVERGGRPDLVKVLDFGVMALSQDAGGVRVGTPGYMAPEQAQAGRPTPAMDIYALGTVLYEMLAGVLPYASQDLDAFIAEQAAQPPPALRSNPGAEEVPSSLERVVHRALERDPAARQASMADLEADLLRAQREAGLTSRWDDLPPPDGLREQRRSEPRAPRRRRALALAAALALSVGSAAALLLLVRPGDRSPARASAAEHVEPRSGTPPTPAVRVTPPLRLPERSSPPRAESVPVGTQQASAARPLEEAGSPARGTTGQPEERPPRTQKAALGRGASTPQTERPLDSGAVARLNAEGGQYLREGRLNEARQRFLSALKGAPRSAVALCGLAEVAFEQAQNERAIELARQASAIDPRLLRAHLVRGDACYRLHRLEEARQAWGHVLRLDPANQSATRRLARLGQRAE